jgi:hypothetical protein
MQYPGETGTWAYDQTKNIYIYKNVSVSAVPKTIKYFEDNYVFSGKW